MNNWPHKDPPELVPDRDSPILASSPYLFYPDAPVFYPDIQAIHPLSPLQSIQDIHDMHIPPLDMHDIKCIPPSLTVSPQVSNHSVSPNLLMLDSFDHSSYAGAEQATGGGLLLPPLPANNALPTTSLGLGHSSAQGPGPLGHDRTDRYKFYSPQVNIHPYHTLSPVLHETRAASVPLPLTDPPAIDDPFMIPSNAVQWPPSSNNNMFSNVVPTIGSTIGSGMGVPFLDDLDDHPFRVKGQIDDLNLESNDHDSQDYADDSQDDLEDEKPTISTRGKVSYKSPRVPPLDEQPSLQVKLEDDEDQVVPGRVSYKSPRIANIEQDQAYQSLFIPTTVIPPPSTSNSSPSFQSPTNVKTTATSELPKIKETSDSDSDFDEYVPSTPPRRRKRAHSSDAYPDPSFNGDTEADFDADDGEGDLEGEVISDDSEDERPKKRGRTRRMDPPPNKRRHRRPASASNHTTSSLITCTFPTSTPTDPSNPSNGSRPGICGVQFRRPYDLARHQDSLHGEGRKEWTCKECGGSFSRKDAVIRHARTRKHAHGL